MKIRHSFIIVAVVSAMLMAAVIAAVVVFNSQGKNSISKSEDFEVVSGILRDRLELELLKLEKEADRLGRLDQLSGASDLLDRDAVNRELSALVNTRQGMFAGIYDFEGDLLGVYGVDAPSVETGLNQSAVKSSLAGRSSSGLARIGERAVMIAVSPVGGVGPGGTNSAGGAVFIGLYVSPAFLERMIGHLPADITFAIGNQVLATSLQGNSGSTLLAELLKTEKKSKFRSKVNGRLALAGPILEDRTFGQDSFYTLAAVVPDGSLTLRSGWLLHVLGSVLLALTLSVLIGIHFYRRSGLSLIHWKKSLSGFVPGVGSSTKTVSASGVSEFDEFGFGVVQLLASWSEKSEEATLAHKKLEQRSRRIIDLLAIDDTDFANFVRKVRSVESTVAKDLGRLKNEFGSSSAQQSSETVSALLRSIYLIRNEAHLFKLQFVYQSAKQFESYIIKVMRGEIRSDQSMFDHLLSSLRELSHEVTSYCDLREELLGSRTVYETEMGKARLQIQWLKSMMARLLVLVKDPSRSGFDAERLASEFEHALGLVSRQDIRSLIERHNSVVSEMAVRAGKQVGPLMFEGTKTHFRPATIQSLNDLFSNVFRNCIHHGIESPEVRRKAAKQGAGTISISSKVWADTIEIQISDDGKGADSERLIQKAVASGLITKTEADTMTESEKLALMFEPGLTTSQVVSDVAGRGVGMDIIRQTAADLGGTVEVSSEAGEGLTLRICFPDYMSRFKTRASVFSLKTEIESLFKTRAYLLQRAGVEAILALQSGNRSMVMADKLFVVEGWRQIILALIAELPQGAKVEVSEVLESSVEVSMGGGCPLFRHVLKISSGIDVQKVMRDFAASPFIELAQEMFLEACVDLEVDVKNAEVRLAVSSNLPLHLCEYPLIVLGPSNDLKIKSAFELRIKEMTGDWTWQYFGYNEVELFIEATKTGMPIAVIDKAGRENAAVVGATRLLVDANVILLFEDAGSATPDEVFGVGHDPLIVSGVLDAPSIDQALEMTMLRMFRGQGQQDLKSLGILPGEQNGEPDRSLAA